MENGVWGLVVLPDPSATPLTPPTSSVVGIKMSTATPDLNLPMGMSTLRWTIDNAQCWTKRQHRDCGLESFFICQWGHCCPCPSWGGSSICNSVENSPLVLSMAVKVCTMQVQSTASFPASSPIACWPTFHDGVGWLMRWELDCWFPRLLFCSLLWLAVLLLCWGWVGRYVALVWLQLSDVCPAQLGLLEEKLGMGGHRREICKGAFWPCMGFPLVVKLPAVWCSMGGGGGGGGWPPCLSEPLTCSSWSPSPVRGVAQVP